MKWRHTRVPSASCSLARSWRNHTALPLSAMSGLNSKTSMIKLSSRFGSANTSYTASIPKNQVSKKIKENIDYNQIEKSMTRPDDQVLLECRWHPTRNNHNLNFNKTKVTDSVFQYKENAKQNKTKMNDLEPVGERARYFATK